MGVEYLSSYLRSFGHSVSLVFDPQLFKDDFSNIGNSVFADRTSRLKDILISEVIDSEPDLVAFSAVTDQYRWALDFAKDIKEKREDLPVIFGGIHPTSVPDIVIKNPEVDIVCVGEGEEAFLELVNSLDDYKKKRNLTIKNLWFKKDGQIYKNPVRDLNQELDRLPFPDKDLFYDKLPAFKLQYNLLTGRGCPYRCSYCCNNFLYKTYKDRGRYLRRRGVANVIEELRSAKQKYKFPLVFIRDEVFIYDIKWLREFAKEYRKEINIPFKCFAHPSVSSAEVVYELKEAGCIYVSMGIQSANEQSRKSVLFRTDTNAQIESAMALFHKAGIKVNIDHIAGIPGEGEKEMAEAAGFYSKIRPDVVTYFWLTLYPRTEMVDIFKARRLATEDEITKIEEGLGSSDFMGGSVSAEKKKTFLEFRSLLCYIPLLPEFIVKIILKYKLYRFMAIKSIFLSSLLPRLLLAPFNNDIRAWVAEIGYNIGKIKYVKNKLR